MSVSTENAKMTYKVKDMSLAEWGRKEIRLAEAEMPDKSGKEDYKRLHIKLGKISVTGGLKREVIIKLLEKFIPSANRCYEKKPWWQWNVKGEFVFKLTVDSSGRVTKVSRIAGTKKIKALEGCIIQKLKNLQFLSSKGSKKGTITVTFLLK